MQESQTIFLIEQMQPSWLRTRLDRLLFRIGFPLIGGMVFAVFWALFYAVTLRPELQPRATVFGLIAGFIFAIVFAINGGRIQPIENLRWSWKNARRSLPQSLLSAAGFILLFIAIFWNLGFQDYIVAVTYGLLLGILVGLGNAFRGVDVKTKLYPNQGIWQSARNSLVFGIFMGVISALTMGTVDFIFRNESFQEAYNIISLLRIALFFGLLAGMIGGGKALLQHVLLRYRLYRQGFMPWNYASFLGYCCDRIFLQKVGGGYIFIHRLLLEHFAALGKRSQL